MPVSNQICMGAEMPMKAIPVQSVVVLASITHFDHSGEIERSVGAIDDFAAFAVFTVIRALRVA
jgi:hypothetical protein